MPLNALPPRGAMMFITTPVPVGEAASTPLSLSSESCTASPPKPMEWADESRNDPAGAPSSVNTWEKITAPLK